PPFRVLRPRRRPDAPLRRPRVRRPAPPAQPGRPGQALGDHAREDAREDLGRVARNPGTRDGPLARAIPQHPGGHGAPQDAPDRRAWLADLGADVIKVEPIDGEPLRWLLEGGGAVKITQGKRDIAIELKTPEGQEILRKLLARADLVMHNYRPGAPKRLN